MKKITPYYCMCFCLSSLAFIPTSIPLRLPKSLNKPKDTVVIRGDIPPGDYLFFYYYDSLGINLKRYHTVADSDGNFLIKVNLTKPILAEISKDGIYYSLWLKPGHTLYIEAGKRYVPHYKMYSYDSSYNNELKFWNNFSTRFNVPSFCYNAFSPTINIDYYYNTLAKQYNGYTHFLDSFNKSNPMSSYGKRFASEVIYYEYLMYLMEPYLYKDYDFNKLPPFYVKKLLSYKNEFNNDKLSDMEYYQFAAWNYNKFLTKQFVDSTLSLSSQYKSATHNFKGPTRDWVLFKILQSKLDEDGIISFENWVSRFKKDCRTIRYIYFVDSLEKQFRGITKNVQVVGTSFSLLNGDNTTWKEILKSNRGKMLLIDFWASWCVPCKDEIPYAIKLRKQLEGKKINFMYISLDIKKEKWEKGVKSLFGNDDSTQQYFLDDGFKSPLAKEIGLNSIPHYLLINENGNIISGDAPRPNNPKLLQMINEYLKK